MVAFGLMPKLWRCCSNTTSYELKHWKWKSRVNAWMRNMKCGQNKICLNVYTWTGNKFQIKCHISMTSRNKKVVNCILLSLSTFSRLVYTISTDAWRFPNWRSNQDCGKIKPALNRWKQITTTRIKLLWLHDIRHIKIVITAELPNYYTRISSCFPYSVI